MLRHTLEEDGWLIGFGSGPITERKGGSLNPERGFTEPPPGFNEGLPLPYMNAGVGFTEPCLLGVH